MCVCAYVTPAFARPVTDNDGDGYSELEGDYDDGTGGNWGGSLGSDERGLRAHSCSLVPGRTSYLENWHWRLAHNRWCCAHDLEVGD